MFGLMDAASKYLSTRYPTPQIIWLRYVFTIPMAAAGAGARAASAARCAPPGRGCRSLRSLLLVLEIGLVVWCFGRMPLADVHAMLALTPLAVTALSVPLLGERVGPRRWAAVAWASLGVMIILRPGLGVMQPASLVALVSVLLYALYQVLTRMVGRVDGAETSLLWQLVVGARWPSFVVPFAWRTPELEHWPLFVLVAALGGVGHYAMIRALQLAPAAVIQPFTYTLLLWAVVIGYVGFGDLPDRWTLLPGHGASHRSAPPAWRYRPAIARSISFAPARAADRLYAATCTAPQDPSWTRTMPPNPGSPAEPLTVIAELRFDPAHREAVLELAQRHVRNTLAAERDCLRFELVAPKDDPGVLVFSEMFASEAAFAAHRESAHAAWFREARAPYVVEATVRELRPRGARRPGRRALRHATCWRSPRLPGAAGAKPGSRSGGTSSGATFTEAELIERLDGVVATIAGLEPYTERVFAAAPGLKVVARVGVGYEQVDVAAATRHGVAVAMAFGTNHDAVADHAMALMAAAAHRIVEYDRRVRAGGWGTLLHGRLHETTVGIVGFGRIGRAVAKRCLGFNMEVLVADPVAEVDTVARLGYRLVDLDELLRQADFVSLHAPLTAETRHLIDARRLGADEARPPS